MPAAGAGSYSEFMQDAAVFSAGIARPALKGQTMLKWALIFAVISLIAGVLGFGGVAAGAAGIAKILFFVFLFMVLLFLLLAALGIGALKK
jgi:uncharacterized membrane protein YtjA (UPF0391 family)